MDSQRLPPEKAACPGSPLYDAGGDSEADGGGDGDEAARRLELIAGYLLPLELTDEGYPVEEHARIAAEIIRRTREAE